jgi:hypothetical protein
VLQLSVPAVVVAATVASTESYKPGVHMWFTMRHQLKPGPMPGVVPGLCGGAVA